MLPPFVPESTVFGDIGVFTEGVVGSSTLAIGVENGQFKVFEHLYQDENDETA